MTDGKSTNVTKQQYSIRYITGIHVYAHSLPTLLLVCICIVLHFVILHYAVYLRGILYQY